MIFSAFAELVLDWQGLPYTLPNIEKAKDTILGIRATILEQMIDKRLKIPYGIKQTIKVELEEIDGILTSIELPNTLLKANAGRVTTTLGIPQVQIDLISELNASLSYYKRKTALVPRAYFKENILRITNGFMPFVYYEDVFQNPLEVMEYQGKDSDQWNIEESLFGQFKSFILPNVRSNDGGEIRITESDLQNNVSNLQR